MYENLRLAVLRRTALLTLVVSSIITVLVTLLINSAIANIVQDRFEAQVKETKSSIDLRLKSYDLALSGTKGLFDSSEFVTRDEWNTFVSSQSTAERLPGMYAIGYSKVIGNKEMLDSHIKEIREQGLQNYTVWPEGDRDVYHAIIYISPLNERTKYVIGYDMHTEPTRRAAMDLASDTNYPTLSGKVRLIQESQNDPQSGFLLYYPLYEKGKPIQTVDERRHAISGFVGMAFRMNDLMDGILGATNNNIAFKIYDMEEAPQNLMYDYSLVKNIQNDSLDQSLSKHVTIDVDQRQWVLNFVAQKSIRTDLEAIIPSLVLLAGLSLSVLLFFIFRTYEKNLILTQQSIKNEKMAAMGELASRLAHDIRNPLTVIKMSSELLERQLGGQNKKEIQYVSAISAASIRMQHQIDDVLDFVRTKPLDLAMNSILEIITESIKTTPIHKNVQVNLPQNDVVIECDKRQLVVVFSNLITNSIQAIGEKDGTVTINIMPENHNVIIEIVDSGPGILQENVSKIFDPLFTTKLMGTGLGLVSCKNIITAHHGKISAKNNPTTFTIELPIRQ